MLNKLQEIITLYVHDERFPKVMRTVFDEIAESWYQVRHYSRFSQELEEVAQRWRTGRLLNIGCAHGADFLPFRANFELWGLDFSTGMIKLAQKYAQKFSFEVNLTVGDARFLPYEESIFNWIISVAALHNIEGKEARHKALSELKTVLKPGGEAFITVWNRWQPKFWFQGKEVRIPWHLKDKTVHRYYYLFSYGELKKLLTEVGFEIVKVFPEKSYRLPLKVFSKNICLLIKKPGLY